MPQYCWQLDDVFLIFSQACQGSQQLLPAQWHLPKGCATSGRGSPLL
jgi:hypothetical protein